HFYARVPTQEIAMTKRATGAGRVETGPLQPPTHMQGIFASLINFDFDDAAVKPEHRAWLMTNVVPTLTPNRRSHVYLRGSASRLGNRDYNFGLSERRVEAVRDFLVGQGVKAGQISLNWTGENNSVAAAEDDEHDRAVFLFLEGTA